MRYRTFLASPSGGMEAAHPSRFWLFIYRALGIILFSLLACGSALGSLTQLRYMLIPGWSANFWAYLQPQFDSSLPFSWHASTMSLFSKDLLVILLIIVSAPLCFTLLIWLRRIWVLLVGVRLKPGRAADGIQQLEQRTRPGLYIALCQALRCPRLQVQFRSTQFQSTFGMAILRTGPLWYPSYALIIDPLFFAILREPAQREALLWHEIAHLRLDSPLRSLFFELAFNIWGEQVKSILSDSLALELAADRYAAAQMGSPLPLQGALLSLKAVEWGFAPQKKDSLLTNVLAILKVMVGGQGMFYVHPNAEIRLAELAKIK